MGLMGHEVLECHSLTRGFPLNLFFRDSIDGPSQDGTWVGMQPKSKLKWSSFGQFAADRFF